MKVMYVLDDKKSFQYRRGDYWLEKIKKRLNVEKVRLLLLILEELTTSKHLLKCKSFIVKRFTISEIYTTIC